MSENMLNCGQYWRFGTVFLWINRKNVEILASYIFVIVGMNNANNKLE